MLDEVIAGLNPTEALEMVELIKKIRAEGMTILMIEHVMKAIMGVSDRVIVLNYGQKIAEGPPEEIVANPEVIEAYLGGKADAHSAINWMSSMEMRRHCGMSAWKCAKERS